MRNNRISFYLRSASTSLIMSLWHGSVKYLTSQCEKNDIVVCYFHIAMSYCSLNKCYTSVMRITSACQISLSYVKTLIAMSNISRNYVKTLD
jgi:hypothetical protein